MVCIMPENYTQTDSENHSVLRSVSSNQAREQ
jgi:hypothetical protein